MDNHEKTLHITMTLVGDNVDAIDVYKIFTGMEGVELSSGNFNCYITKAEKKDIDKKK